MNLNTYDQIKDFLKNNKPTKQWICGCSYYGDYFCSICHNRTSNSDEICNNCAQKITHAVQRRLQQDRIKYQNW